MITDTEVGRDGDARQFEVTISDKQVLRILEDFPTYGEKCSHLSKAAEIGVLTLAAVEPFAFFREVEKQFSSWRDEIDALVGKKAPIAEKFSEALREYFDGDSSKLASLLSPTDTAKPVGQMLEKLRTTRLEDINEAKDLLGKVRTEVQDLIDRLKEREAELEKREAVETALKRTPVSGANFEEKAFNYINRFVAAPGQDQATWEGAQPSPLGQKGGDIVYEVNAQVNAGGGKAVIEAKSKDSLPQSGKTAYFFDELAGGMDKHSAEYGIVLLDSSKLERSERHPGFYLRRFPDNKYVALVDEDFLVPPALDAAIWSVKLDMQRKARGLDIALNVELLNDKVEAAISVLSRFKGLKQKCTGIENAAKELQEELAKAENDISNALQAVRDELGRQSTQAE